jgi:ACS family tartrate transporter-like MFS transporter
MPPMFLTGTAAVSRMDQFLGVSPFGPWYVGVIKVWTDSYAGGLYGLAFLCVMSAVVCALFLHIPNPTVTRGRTAALAAE